MKVNSIRVSLGLALLIVSTIAAADITNPEVLERKPVPYPIEAKKLASEGDVELRVWVNANGTAGEVVVLRSSGDAHLDRAAALGVKDWTYKPSRRDSGEVIGNTMLVKVHFQLTDEDMQSAPPQSQLQRYARIWANYVTIAHRTRPSINSVRQPEFRLAVHEPKWPSTTRDWTGSLVLLKPE